MVRKSMYVFKLEKFDYNDTSNLINKFVKENKPREIAKGVIEGFFGFKDNDEYLVFRYYYRTFRESSDPYTGETIRSVRIISPYIIITRNGLLMITSSKASLADKILGLLPIEPQNRSTVSFSPDFIEYVNTAFPDDPLYNDVFDDDLVNYLRSGRDGDKHVVSEGYSDLKYREKITKTALRYATGLVVALPERSLKLKIYSDGKITFEKLPGKFLEMIPLLEKAINRVLQAQNVFLEKR